MQGELYEGEIRENMKMTDFDGEKESKNEGWFLSEEGGENGILQQSFSWNSAEFSELEMGTTNED